MTHANLSRKKFLQNVWVASAAYSVAPLSHSAIFNPCGKTLPAHLAGHAAVVSAWKGIAAVQAWDAHAHAQPQPLVGVRPLFSQLKLAKAALLDKKRIPILEGIQGYNPLLFTFVLKRQLRSSQQELPENIFHTREFFLRCKT